MSTVSVLRGLATIGALVVIATIDGVISGTVSAFWGDVWGKRVDDIALFLVALAGIHRWIREAIPTPQDATVRMRRMQP